jgi:DNA repair protein RadA/Sms
VLGGGLVPGSVVLLAGEPGIGKSTLVLQLLDGAARAGAPSFLMTGEESIDQVSLRAARLGINNGGFLAAAGTSLNALLDACAEHRPRFLVVDSIQTLEDVDIEQGPGSITQVRDCAARLIQYAKASATSIVLVGHVTKEGSVAGPKTLEHMVDVVLALDGERSGSVRLLRSTKNRFGSCDETGVFTMEERGLQPVDDPSAMLLADRCEGISGSIVFPGLEGTRPVLMELQALVTDSELPQPRRVASGIDPRRLALMLGVLAERAGIKAGNSDVFVTAAGGLTVREPAADLPLALALCSAKNRVPIAEGIVAFGEVGLGGEVRRVPGSDRRLAEAARLGFRTAIVPRGLKNGSARGLQVIEVAHVSDAHASLKEGVV